MRPAPAYGVPPVWLQDVPGPTVDAPAGLAEPTHQRPDQDVVQPREQAEAQDHHGVRQAERDLAPPYVQGAADPAPLHLTAVGGLAIARADLQALRGVGQAARQSSGYAGPNGD